MIKPLPPVELRRCGNSFPRDDYWVGTAMYEAERLADYFKLNCNSNVLDIGCGVGRLCTGLVEKGYQYKSYTGIDVDQKAIDWCKEALEDDNHKFRYIDIRNERFNPEGSVLMDKTFKLPLLANEYEIIYAWAVFPHLRLVDTRIYLNEFRRLLTKDGSVFLTAHIEENVPDEEENPVSYPPKYGNRSNGTLHRVRYNKKAFFDAVDGAGLKVAMFNHNGDWNFQTTIKLVNK